MKGRRRTRGYYEVFNYKESRRRPLDYDLPFPSSLELRIEIRGETEMVLSGISGAINSLASTQRLLT